MKRLLLWLRYRLINALVGEMPVVMNMAFLRPPGYTGKLYLFPETGQPGMFKRNELIDIGDMGRKVIVVPRRNVRISPIVQPTAGERSRLVTSK